MNDQQVVTELIEEKIATLQHKVADTRATIELYKIGKVARGCNK